MSLHQRKTSLIAGLALAGLALAAPARAEFLTTYTSGHADIAVLYEGGSAFELHYHFGPGAVLDGVPLAGGLPTSAYEFDPSEINIFVPLSTGTARPAGAQWDFLGTAAGSTVYVLPQTNVPSLPFVGIASDELNPTQWSTPITWTLNAASGPGQFSLYQTDLFGNPVERWSTSNGTPDAFTLPVGGHDHFNYAFTAPGAYDLTIAASARTAAGLLVSDTATFRFQVGPPEVEVIPEPSGLVLAGMGAGMLLLARSWRRKATPPPASA